MIRNYNESDYDMIEYITEDYWKNEVEMDLELQHFIYHFLVRYYLYDNKYSYVIDDGDVRAFLLSCLKTEKNKSIELFNKTVSSLSNENQKKAYEYLKYIEDNHNKVLSHMDNDSVYLGLIASKIHHGGMDLINKLISDVKASGLGDIYLWTDETCNYKYYERLNFELIETYFINLYGRTIKTFIYKRTIKK